MRESCILQNKIYVPPLTVKPTTLHPQFYSDNIPTLEFLAQQNLPAGRPFVAPDGRGAGWAVDYSMSAEQCAEYWLRFARRFPETVLWPLGVHHSHVEKLLGDEIQHRWELLDDDPYAIPPDALTPSLNSWREDGFNYERWDNQTWYEYICAFLKDELGWKPHLRNAQPSALPESPFALLGKVPWVKERQGSLFLYLAADRRSPLLQLILVFRMKAFIQE